MIHYATIGIGDRRRERPVCFDHTLAFEFEKTTGKHYLLETKAILTELIMAGALVGTDDAATAARHVSIVRFVDFIHAGLRLGARKEKQPIDFDEYDVADWLLNPENGAEAVSQLTTWFIEATYTPAPSANGKHDDADEGDAKKKTVPIGGS